jgi:hypothetical protein
MLIDGVEDFNRGTSYLNKKRHEKALQFFKRSIKASPVKEVYLNMANCLSVLDRDMEAAHCYALAADVGVPCFNGLSGPYPAALNNLGLINYRYDNLNEAISCYLQCLELDPLNWDCIWNYSNALLKSCCEGISTEWSTAWNMYELRFKREGSTPVDPNFRTWTPFTTVSKIVVLHEQGQGDKIQFARYLKNLKQWCDHLVLQCEPDLHHLFQNEGYEVVWNDDLYTHLDGYGVAWMSLAKHFNHEAPGYNWIKHPYNTHHFKSGLNIIVENSGNPLHTNDRNRSCTWDNFEVFRGCGNLWTFKGSGPGWLNKLNTKSWTETISYLLGCDLLITVDTSVAHLAGTLGVKTLLLQPLKETDWRWGLTGKTNIWYPSVVVIRNPNNWKKTFQQAHNEFKALQLG